MKNVLIISYYFPPLSDVGGLRALGFSKYLHEYGWKPFVLSVSNPDRMFCAEGKENVPEDINVFYSPSIVNLGLVVGKLNGLLAKVLKVFGKTLKSNFFYNIFCIPDIFIGWIPITVVKGLFLIRKYNIDIIYVSCKPLSSSIIGTWLKKITGKPLIVDLRDPTIENFSENKNFSNQVNEKFSSIFEKYILKTVDKLIFVTKITEANYIKKYPFLLGKTECIYNGIFAEMFPNNYSESFEKFTIIYVGNFYIDYGDPELIFRALNHLVSNGVIKESDIRFIYFGSNAEWFSQMRDKHKLKDLIEAYGSVPRKESIKNLYNSTVIYLRIVRDMISTKLYEGLATGRPLIAAISNDEVKNIIEKYSCDSIICNEKDERELCEAINKLYKAWKSGNLKRKENHEYLKNFDKKKLTGDLAFLLYKTLHMYRGS